MQDEIHRLYCYRYYVSLAQTRKKTLFARKPETSSDMREFFLWTDALEAAQQDLLRCQAASLAVETRLLETIQSEDWLDAGYVRVKKEVYDNGVAAIIIEGQEGAEPSILRGIGGLSIMVVAKTLTGDLWPERLLNFSDATLRQSLHKAREHEGRSLSHNIPLWRLVGDIYEGELLRRDNQRG